jgi:hypothetical protein
MFFAVFCHFFKKGGCESVGVSVERPSPKRRRRKKRRRMGREAAVMRWTGTEMDGRLADFAKEWRGSVDFVVFAL